MRSVLFHFDEDAPRECVNNAGSLFDSCASPATGMGAVVLDVLDALDAVVGVADPSAVASVAFTFVNKFTSSNA